MRDHIGRIRVAAERAVQLPLGTVGVVCALLVAGAAERSRVSLARSATTVKTRGQKMLSACFGPSSARTAGTARVRLRLTFHQQHRGMFVTEWLRPKPRGYLWPETACRRCRLPIALREGPRRRRARLSRSTAGPVADDNIARTVPPEHTHRSAAI